MNRKNVFDSPDWPKLIEKGFRRVVRAAIREHMKANNPVYYEKNGRLIKLLPSGREVTVKKLPAGI